MKKIYLYVGTALATGAILVAVPVFAASRPTSTLGHFLGFDKFKGAPSSISKPVIVGTVTAISGTTLTVVAVLPGRNAMATSTYTVDASHASVNQGTTTVALSNLAINSRIAVSGTVLGTSVTATKIALMPTMSAGMHGLGNPMPGDWKGGQGHIATGLVTAVSGGQFTIATKMPKQATSTETIVTTSATTFKQNGQSASLGSLAVGNLIMATGTTTTPGTFTASMVRIMTSRAKAGVR